MLSQILMVFALLVLTYMVWITMTADDICVNNTQSATIPDLTVAVQTNTQSAIKPDQKVVPTNKIESFNQNSLDSNNNMDKTLDNMPPFNDNMPPHMRNMLKNKKLENFAHDSKHNMPPRMRDMLKNKPYMQENQPVENFANGVVNNISDEQMVFNEKAVSPSMPSVNINKPQLLNTYPKMNLNSPADLSNINEINYASVPSNFKGSQVSGETNDDVNDVYKVDGTDLLAAPLADRFYYTNSIANVNRNASSDLRGDIAISYNDTFTPFYQSSIYGEPLTVNRLGDSK